MVSEPETKENKIVFKKWQMMAKYVSLPYGYV